MEKITKDNNHEWWWQYILYLYSLYFYAYLVGIFLFYLRQASKYFYAYLVFLYLCQAPSIIASHTILDYCSAYPLIIHPLMGRHALANKSLPYLGFGVRYLRRLFQQPTTWHIWVFGWTTYRGYIWPDPLNIWVLGIWFLIFASVHSA